ncbi:Aste57867_22716 [Aphanomyces stellatus]|uniref:Aste57867_22716 protein n=1 Tax=Aphanomyces stellatus TaxID=120398 RepID=A0A485LKR1_9STRA|nr:hypothetical protein As57867_022646 [Aphanomyces stellatus]VFT99370.1 Aste57867_22716 [Aphanomyces stellatus]
MIELAIMYKALVVNVEHRFYGHSQPTGDITNDSLSKYHNMKQVLADLATFQDHFNAQLNLTKANKWVTFGGSYPVQLSGFVKSKYPDQFAGARLRRRCPSTQSSTFRNTPTSWPMRYNTGADQDHAADATTLNTLFNLCAPIKNDDDRDTVKGNVFGNFQGIVQCNGIETLNGVKDTCNYFANAANGATPLDRLAAFTRKNWGARKCTGSD